MILGVSSWLEGKIGLSANIIRIIFVLAVIFAGTGLLAYFILWLVKLLTK